MKDLPPSTPTIENNEANDKTPELTPGQKAKIGIGIGALVLGYSAVFSGLVDVHPGEFGHGTRYTLGENQHDTQHVVEGFDSTPDSATGIFYVKPDENSQGSSDFYIKDDVKYYSPKNNSLDSTPEPSSTEPSN